MPWSPIFEIDPIFGGRYWTRTNDPVRVKHVL